MTDTTNNVPTAVTITNTIKDIKSFRDIVRNALTKDIDYGIIPHTGDKPALYKSGAEKIAHILNVNACFEVLHHYESWENGTFGYTIKCSLSGNTTSEGLGACSTLESKYAKQNGYTLQNTVLKMAKKRAYIDAVLTASGLSDMFTQDVEDLDINDNIPVENQEEIISFDDCKSTTYYCEGCGGEITEKVYKYSSERLGHPLCYACQKK